MLFLLLQNLLLSCDLPPVLLSALLNALNHVLWQAICKSQVLLQPSLHTTTLAELTIQHCCRTTGGTASTLHALCFSAPNARLAAFGLGLYHMTFHAMCFSAPTAVFRQEVYHMGVSWWSFTYFLCSL